MKKRIFSWILVVAMCITTVVTPEMYFASDTIEKAEYEINAEESLNGNQTSFDGKVLSYREGPELDTRWTKENIKNANRPVYGTIPASYSSTDALDGFYTFEVQKDYLTAVRDQNPYGSCWAHSAMCLAETSYIMETGVTPESLDYNEYHHVWYAYYEAKDELGLLGGDRNYNNTKVNLLDGGGNLLISLAMLSAWTGASDATEEEYGAEDILYYEENVLNGAKEPEASFAWTDAAHMENGYILTMPSVDYPEYWEMDMQIVKQAVMDYGAVGMSYFAYHTDPYYVDDAYQYVNQRVATNHAVTIVGWDDTIPAESFGITPPGDGAWLVRNSWGEDWGQNGYFWLSYYDLTIGTNAFVFDFTSANNYDNNYQYDGGSNYAGYYYSDEKITGANAFVADSDELIEAVGLGTMNIGSDYVIDIYRNLEADALPNEGNLAYTQSGHLDYAGFHTIELSSAVAVEAGERYAIVVTIYTPGVSATLCCDYTTTSWGWVWFKSYAKAGQSYLMNWDGFEDMNPDNTENADGENLRIKSFTNERTDGGEVKVTGLEFARRQEDVIVNESIQLKPVFTPSTATNMKLSWTSSDESVATVDNYGNVTTLKIGTTIITATTTDGSNISASCMVNVVKAPVYIDYMEITYEGVVIEELITDEIGATYPFGVTIYPSNADVQEVVWDSSNDDVVTVDKNGAITIVGIGEAIVTAYSTDGSGVNTSIPVTVTPVYVEEIMFDVDYLELEVGESYTVQATVFPENADNKELIWYSSDSEVATVDQNGKVTGILAGEALLRIESADGMVTRYLRVIVSPISIKDIIITYNGEEITEYTIEGVGEYLDLDARVEPENAASKAFIWESSNTSVATIDAYGIVTTVGSGMTVITATAMDGSGVSASCVITVNAPLPTFTVEHYVMNVNGEYELAKTETLTHDASEKVCYTYGDFVKSEYNDGQILSFVQMRENGQNISMFWPNEDGTSVVQLYYERWMTPVYIAIELNESYSDYAMTQAYYIGSVVNITEQWIKEQAAELFAATGELEIQGAVVEQGNIELTHNDGKYSFITPINNGMVIIKFVVFEKITYEVEHYVMGEDGTYALVEEEVLEGYQKDSYLCENFIKDEYNTGSTYFKTLTVNDAAIAGLDINTIIRLEDGDVVKVYYDRAIILEGWHQADDGNWYYYTEGEVDNSVNGLVYNEAEDAWWYAVNGKADFTYTGLTLYNGVWYYVENGVLNWGYTGLTLYNGAWYYVEGGVLNWGYTGLTLYNGTWYYVEGGVLNWNYTGLTCYYDTWYYVEGGILNWNYTGLTCYFDTWYYVEGGILNWNYTGLTCYYGTWYYVAGGVLNWGYTGLTLYYDAWYYVEGGVLNWNYTGLTCYNGTWYYVGNGILDWTYTGTIWYNGILWYVENGVLVGIA